MAEVHRNGDSRSCGASTVSGQGKNVFANGKLVSINGDPNSHGGGALSASVNQVFVGGTMIVDKGDSASADSLCPSGPSHCSPNATGGSPNVIVGN